ncbi:MAG: T9SS type A sorting domain-containing protein [Candidatus Zixiibacteriota bacterium]|jgi:hypothetical protein
MKKLIITLSLGALLLAGAASAERWPLGPGDVPQPCGNNCYNFQNYGGSSYYHDGLDCLGLAGDPCYSVDDGYMVLISESEPLYTGVVINYTNGQDKGWLYWHLTFSTIPFVEGDPVNLDDRIGNLADWPTSNFHHVHFTRGYYPGIGNWYNAVDNPIEFMVPGTDTQPPTFEEAETGQMFSFCENNSTVRVDPNDVKGQVDIIAHVGDKIVDTNWDVVPYDIEWWVDGTGGTVPVTKFVTFTGACPADSTVTTVCYKREGIWYTQGNYSSREYYFIVTNTDGDGIVEFGDQDYYFDTTALPDGAYTLYVQAKDYYGNTTVESMPFTINNSSDVRLKTFAARPVPKGVELTWDVAETEPVTYNLYRYRADEGARAGLSGREPLNVEPISGESPYTYRDVTATAGVEFEYWLEAVELSGVRTTFGPAVAEAGVSRPKAFALYGVAPNPTRGKAVFSFALPQPSRAELVVYDLAGRRVATVVDEDLAAGEYEYASAADFAPGVYIYRLTAGDFASAKKFVVVE